MTNPLADPFLSIFTDRAEADQAFDLLRDAARRLRIQGAYDPRVAVTLSQRSGRHYLRLNFGGWLVLGFRGSGQAAERVDMALLADRVAWDERFTAAAFERKEGEPEVRSYELLSLVRPMTTDLRRAFEDTLDFIADKFEGWRRATHWKQHNPEIIEALFDVERREQLFATGLTDLELRYERHLTAFGQAVAEEEIGYGLEEEEGEVEVKRKDDDGQSEQFKLNLALPLADIAAETGFDAANLTGWVRAIERKGQAVLYGPPGTGKTFIAQKLAAHLIGGGDGFAELVQFHPAYAYEDFMQGIRPELRDGLLTYTMKPGRFLDFCRQAAQRDGICVLIIDEINRANLSRVFGELMYLLEYRGEAVPLAGGGSLRIPPNVRLLGTMNTADRSIALVDHALRRRFAFIRLHPNFEALRRYHQRHKTGFPVEALVGVLTRLNQHIDDPHYEIGITFFLRETLAADLPDIWRMEIEPYLEEYFFNQPGKLDEFRWAAVAPKFNL